MDDLSDKRYHKYSVNLNTNAQQRDINRQLENSYRCASVRPSERPIDDHWLIHIDLFDTPFTPHHAIGVAHSEAELLEKTYQCAKTYAKNFANDYFHDFVDLTIRGKEPANT